MLLGPCLGSAKSLPGKLNPVAEEVDRDGRIRGRGAGPGDGQRDEGDCEEAMHGAPDE